jgi:hypothetical protein
VSPFSAVLLPVVGILRRDLVRKMMHGGGRGAAGRAIAVGVREGLVGEESAVLHAVDGGKPW